MFYEKDIAVAAGTTQAAPAEESLFVVPGIVHFAEIQFPAGCAGLVHLQILNQEVQCWPSNPEGNFKGDDARIGFSEAFEVGSKMTHFKLRAWAPNTYYEHTITVRLGVLKKEELFPLWQTFKAIMLFFRFFKPRAEEEMEVV